MKAALRQRASELGFDDCRVTRADAPETGPQFQQWLAEGHHGQMAWLDRTAAKRLDPQQVLPGARSILALAASYAPESAAPPTAPRTTHHGPNNADRTTGFVARYARFTDYHHILGDRLKQLAQYVDELGGDGTRSLWYVDTGPLLERDLAQRAGVGFIGKHTNLISRRLGNWIFLSEIVTTLELDPDPPERNRCGSCARCIDACPTAAITAPFQLDARRCISYLTIELRGSIPVELRPAIGNRVFGCDDCLEVCPWNRFAREGGLMKEGKRADLAVPGLLELLQLDDAGFKRRFAGTTILRTKRHGLLRNVCVALGNTGDRRALPALEKIAQDPEPLIAEHARWAIGEVQRRQSAGETLRSSAWVKG